MPVLFTAVRPLTWNRPPVVRLMQRFKAALGVPPQQAVALHLATPPAMLQYNAQHRAIRRPTDILAFPLDSPELLGAIVLCPQVAARKAHPLARRDRHLFRLLAHAFCHLVGHDHHTRADHQRVALPFGRCGSSSGRWRRPSGGC